MTGLNQQTTRRGFLGTLTLASAMSAGCSGLGSLTSDQSASTDSSGTNGSDVTPGETPTSTGAEHDHASENHGDAHDHQETASSGGMGVFETKLRERYVNVESLMVIDNRVRLHYVTTSTRGHEIAAGIETVVVSFMQACDTGWSVTGLDAELVEPSGEVMGYWRTEAKWIKPVIKGQQSLAPVMERTLDTYHGRLTRSHDHGDDGHSSTDDEDEDHHNEADHHHSDTETANTDG